jgi:hypothetical protein
VESFIGQVVAMTVSLRHLVVILVGVVLAGGVLLWTQGTFDYAFSSLHLNYKECARNEYGGVFCGEDLEEYDRRAAAAAAPAARPKSPAVTPPAAPGAAPPGPSTPATAPAAMVHVDELARGIEAALTNRGVQNPSCIPVGTKTEKLSCTFQGADGQSGGATVTRLNDPVVRLSVWRRESTDDGGTKIVQLGWTTFDTRTGRFGPLHPSAAAREYEHDAAAKAWVRSIIPAVEAYFADNNTYSGMTLTGLKTTYDQSLDANVYAIKSATATTYCVESTVGGKTWRKAGPAANVERGGCP